MAVEDSWRLNLSSNMYKIIFKITRFQFGNLKLEYSHLFNPPKMAGFLKKVFLIDTKSMVIN